MNLTAFLQDERKLAASEKVTLVLNSDQDSSAIAGHFLRAYRGRRRMSETLQMFPLREGFLAKLEEMRTAISLCQLKKAEAIIESIRPEGADEHNEVGLERCRISLFNGNPGFVIQESDQILKSSQLSPLSRMTLLQIRGVAFLNLKNLEAAIEEFKKCVELAQLFPLAASASDAIAYLVKAYCEIGDANSALKNLKILESLIQSIEQPEIWISRMLALTRARFHFASFVNAWSDAQCALDESQAIAEWLDDQQTLKKCIHDRQQLAKTGSDLKGTQSALSFTNWTLLPKIGAILIDLPKAIHVLNDSPVTMQILLALSEGPLEISELFERVWKIRYKQDRHAVHLRATLSKVRKKLPSNSLTVNDGRISLA